MPGLGFFGLGPWFTGDDVVFAEARANERDDKIDALTKGFLGLTVRARAATTTSTIRFRRRITMRSAVSSRPPATPNIRLAPDARCQTLPTQHAKVKAAGEGASKHFVAQAQIDVATRLAAQTARYLMAARKVMRRQAKPDPAKRRPRLDPETYLAGAATSPPAEDRASVSEAVVPLFAVGGGSEAEAQLAADFQKLLLDVIAEKTARSAANEERKRNRTCPTLRGRAPPARRPDAVRALPVQADARQKVMEPRGSIVWLDVVQGEQARRITRRRTASTSTTFKRAGPVLHGRAEDPG